MLFVFTYVPPPTPGKSGQQSRQHQQYPQSGYPGQQAHLGYPGHHNESPSSVFTFYAVSHLLSIFKAEEIRIDVKSMAPTASFCLTMLFI